MMQFLATPSFAGDKQTSEDKRPSSGPEISEEAVIQFIRTLVERARYVPSELLADPAWGMLLELLHAELQSRRVRLVEICSTSGASMSTAVRWLNVLESHDFIVRRKDQEEDDNCFVELSSKGSSALRRYFNDVVYIPNG